MLAPTLLHRPEHSSNKAFLFTAIGWLVSGGGGVRMGTRVMQNAVLEMKALGI